MEIIKVMMYCVYQKRVYTNTAAATASTTTTTDLSQCTTAAVFQ
jgi:hypothetical protein